MRRDVQFILITKVTSVAANSEVSTFFKVSQASYFFEGHILKKKDMADPDDSNIGRDPALKKKGGGGGR